MDFKTGSSCWGYSRRPKNWRKLMGEDQDYDLFEIMAKSSPIRSRSLTTQEVKELGLERLGPPKLEKPVLGPPKLGQPKLDQPKLGQPSPMLGKPKIDVAVKKTDIPYRDSTYSYH